MTMIEATPKQCIRQDYTTDALLNDGYVPRRYKFVYDPRNNNPVIEESLHCKNPQQECNQCFKLEHQYTLEVTARDDDGDPLRHEWFTYYGYFIVNGNNVYACTTAENYVTYLAPSFGNQDRLQVIVRDDRGGWTFIEGQLGIYGQGTICRCGDANGDSEVNGADASYIINYLFVGEPRPRGAIETGDINNDCGVNSADVSYLINYLFVGGPPPECCWVH
jgi:hypothetical protein